MIAPDDLRRAEYAALYGAFANGIAEVVKPDGGTITAVYYPKVSPLNDMTPAQFIAEFYRRMDVASGDDIRLCNRSWAEVSQDPGTLSLVENYRTLLPADKNARMLDIGFGQGQSIAAFGVLGYTNIEGADFSAAARQGMMNWQGVQAIHEIGTDIGSFLHGKEGRYDFILLAHVIEHIPKTQLFHVLDAIYSALRIGGTLLVRAPNMEGPRPASNRYVTIAHETGFTGAGIEAVLRGSRFRNIRFVTLGRGRQSLRQRLVSMARWLLEHHNRFMHRMFGAYNVGGQYGGELVLTAQRLK